MLALRAGSGPLAGPLRRIDPYHTSPTPSGSVHQPQPQPQPQAQQQQRQPQIPQQAQQPQQVLTALQQQQQQSQQPIRVSLLPGGLKILTSGQVKQLTWQNHVAIFKVRAAA